MKTILLCVLALGLSACSGMSRVPMFELDGETSGLNTFMKTTSDPHAFAPTTQSVVIETCNYTVDYEGPNAHSPKITVQVPSCLTITDHQFNSTTGYVAGMFAPMLQAGAMAYAGHEIGKGLGRSGSVNNTNVSGGNATGGAGGAGGTGGNGGAGGGKR